MLVIFEHFEDVGVGICVSSSFFEEQPLLSRQAGYKLPWMYSEGDSGGGTLDVEFDAVKNSFHACLLHGVPISSRRRWVGGRPFLHYTKK